MSNSLKLKLLLLNNTKLKLRQISRQVRCSSRKISVCAWYLVTKLSASRSSTVCRSMLGGTNSRPFLAHRVARFGDRIWHTQRFGQICARTAMATASIRHSNSLSMVTAHLDATPVDKGGCQSKKDAFNGIETERELKTLLSLETEFSTGRPD